MTKLHQLVLLCLVLVVGILGTGSSTAAAPKATAFNFTMSGAQVVPGSGDPDGTANANVSLHFSKPYTVCAGTNPQNVQRPFTALELHRAPAGEAGPVAVALELGLTGHADAGGCAQVEKRVLQDIQANPELYYLEARNSEFPNGAIRGQLA
jgi:CHRD domain